MKQRIRIHKAEPNKGVADFSHLLDAPAGKHGFVRVRDGHFYFEDGTRTRFLGFNMAARSNTPDHETAEKMAERFASMGVNIIRLHAADAPIGEEPCTWSSCKEAPLLDYESGNSLEFNKEGLDRFDYFVAKLREKGIYLHIDLLVARAFNDLKRLLDEGYTVEVKGGYVLVHDIPYINTNRQCCIGTLVCPLTLSGVMTAKPDTHVMSFIGEQPCNADGNIITSIQHETRRNDFGNGIIVDRTFSNKPRGTNGFDNYYDKFLNYIRIICSPVHIIDPSATPQVYKPIVSEDQSVFKYKDTNTSRANIGSIVDQLHGQKIGIVGLGGTGSYILDQIAKTPVYEIHLYDGDKFYTHNVFRAPGAASVEELNAAPYKTDYFTALYSKMRCGIFSHRVYIGESNLDSLLSMSFVFLSIDSGSDKKYIITELQKASIPFIDTGIGLNIQQNQLSGIARITAVCSDTSDGWAKRISYVDTRDDLYGSNIQIAEINNLCATLAVIKWKKINGFYVDQERSDFTNFDIGMGEITNEN